ncbi:Cytochrome P450 [Streptoalloteichus tenebrarius]|uniref:Cytochrome P450 n=1 Tax=Streptoalloteichus tenebrarius (strain ATCC 17920 / DSM 40477 / JCM 4838 / CBS 697.72 / NBRC 16177 / NCIMB 11028 / NRRL B-12390 / A12253. 1 / ISP 5477) TaxID=1933 RepID=A0ABT1HLU9_STRSD|nr:cytochrome P450 [Streptoalloteichus tenebrarius]MCP2256475.1 Cytochrome P450 [Streptoalloteichus tenebrarius]
MTTEPLTFPLANAGPFDPPSELMAMREGRPIAPLRLPDGRLGWVVVRRATVRSVLADPRFSARQELRGNLSPSGGSLPPAPPGMFIGMDPPDHTHYRHLLTGQFTVRRMRQLTARIEQLAEEHLDRMAAAGPPVDLVATYARPIPAMVICELLGVPDEFRERFGQQVAELSRQDATPEEQQRTLVGILTYLGELVREKRSTPTDDLLGGLVVDGAGLTDEELTNLAFMLLGAGLDTTANMLGLGTLALLAHPEQIPVITNPDTVDNAVEELLRYLAIVPGTLRTALEDVEVEGVTVRAGETVMVSLPVANRDPERFADPDTLDLTRQTSGHVAFGHGVHQCLGQQLARVEMRVAFPALFRRFPTLRLAVPQEEVPLRDEMLIFGVHRLPVTWED